jgi:type I restriction enzyme R subunit
VPPKAISVPLKIVRSGLRYDDLSEEEKDQWDSLEWGEEEPPDTVEAAEINKRLFNEETVDLVIAHLMENGLKVEGGDRLGKTIIFAKNQAHAQFIEKRFNSVYPYFKGHFARVITYESGAYAQALIDDFSKKNAAPHIAISVEMLDTGIEVPEVVNLVFFKPLRSKTKFWQMMGRGTRLCPDLFGPGQDKEFFRVFDYCQNLEFFGANPELKEASAARTLSARLAVAHVRDIVNIDHGTVDGLNRQVAQLAMIDGASLSWIAYSKLLRFQRRPFIGEEQTSVQVGSMSPNNPSRTCPVAHICRGPASPDAHVTTASAFARLSGEPFSQMTY